MAKFYKCDLCDSVIENGKESYLVYLGDGYGYVTDEYPTGIFVGVNDVCQDCKSNIINNFKRGLKSMVNERYGRVVK